MERFFVLDKFNTWYDWDLIVIAKDIPDPEPKTNYIELDGMDGSLDLSESLTGEVVYRDRTISATFWTDAGTREDRVKLKQTITRALHGRKIKIVEPDDPEHYFYGRVNIKSFKNTLTYCEIEIEATCEPWRYALTESVRRVDPNNQAVDVVICNNGSKTLCPTVTVNGTVAITYDGVTTTLKTGSYKITDVKLRRGANVIGVSGSGYAIFTYREADL